MSRIKISIPTKIAFLLFVGIVIILFSGYLSYRSISSVVTMIYKDNAPQEGLATIKDITTIIESAENNIRLYGLTKKNSYLKNYKDLNNELESKIDLLHNQYPEDEWFSSKIDTIQSLVKSKNKLWDEMVLIWRHDTTQNAISDLAREIKTVDIDTVSALRPSINKPDFNKLHKNVEDNGEKEEKIGFFRRIFGKKSQPAEKTDEEEQEQVQEEEPEPIIAEEPVVETKPDKNQIILEKLDKIEKTEKETGLKLQQKETELTESSNKINEALLSLMAQLENYEKKNDQERYERAGELADKTYKYIAIFALSGTLLSIIVLFVIIKYARKNRQYNNALIKSRKETEELAKAKELFMANVSHEIRTPLNAIAGFIKQMLSLPLEKKVKEKMLIVNSASNQLIRLINDILDFSKLQAGKLTLKNVDFKPENVVENTCALFSELAKNKNNFIISKIDNQEDITLLGDAQRFQQILSNLLSNAVKFTQEGRIEILATVQHLSEKAASMKLVVKDTGLGIESSKLEKIFQDFTQEDNDTAVKYGGTGLGLSIVKKLVELFNGNVTVESKKGQGTTVSCYLEFLIGDSKNIIEEDLEELENKLPNGLRFLVADDEEYNRLLITTILNKWNAKYDLAKNGMEAIEFLQSESYDAVLMDLRMPQINGMMATKFIRETLKHSKEEVPVIGITADISNYIPKETKGFFNAFLVKPFTEVELLTIINQEMGLDTKLITEDKPKQTPEKNGKEGNLDNLIRTAGDDLSFVREMIAQFEKSTTNGFEEMDLAIKNGKFDAVGDLAHKLAPASRHLELNELLSLLKEIEKTAEQGNKAYIEKLYIEAKSSFADAQKNLNEQLEQLC